MTSTALENRSPEEIEREIALKRESLYARLHELEDRLSPRAHLRRVRHRVNSVRAEVHPAEYMGWVAIAAVAAGAFLAIRGLRRRRFDPFDDLGCEDGILFVETAIPGDEIYDTPLV